MNLSFYPLDTNIQSQLTAGSSITKSFVKTSYFETVVQFY